MRKSLWARSKTVPCFPSHACTSMESWFDTKLRNSGKQKSINFYLKDLNKKIMSRIKKQVLTIGHFFEGRVWIDSIIFIWVNICMQGKPRGFIENDDRWHFQPRPIFSWASPIVYYKKILSTLWPTTLLQIASQSTWNK